jgi:hypothetical protein
MKSRMQGYIFENTWDLRNKINIFFSGGGGVKIGLHVYNSERKKKTVDLFVKQKWKGSKARLQKGVTKSWWKVQGVQSLYNYIMKLGLP